MAKVNMSAKVGQLTQHGKQMISQSMCEKGKAFIGAALLLRQRNGCEYVVLHLLCQGIEVFGKGYLLSVNYDVYKPKLRNYGHDLTKLVKAIETASGLSIIKPKIFDELNELNILYKQHLLRYGSGYDILVNPNTIPSHNVLTCAATLIRLAYRKNTLIRRSFKP